MQSVQAVLNLLENDCTIPFIARYRKEVTGGLDEVQVAAIRDCYALCIALENRRVFIVETITNQGKLTPELALSIGSAGTLSELEDLYLPFKTKRRTRAQIAIEQGLSGLADELMNGKTKNPVQAATVYVDSEKGVGSAELALQGARDIIAERASEEPMIREQIRALFRSQGILYSKIARGLATSDARYNDFHNFSESVRHLPSHRILALFRGEAAKQLTLQIEIPDDRARAVLEDRFLKTLVQSGSLVQDQIRAAVSDSLQRLIKPSLENELRTELKLRADKDAIQVFANNVREVLMGAPLGTVPVLALDPGFRTGCKVAVLDAGGQLVHHATIYPLEPHLKTQDSSHLIRSLVGQFGIQAIAIGNGTGGRETLSFCVGLALGPAVKLCLVNEDGASIYSASAIAREEFPDLDLTVRGAVSIGRRLMDPLSELVKIDPKSIGVGQYQHDVDQKALKLSLDETISSCVNAVGVDLNTASPALLQHVSGLNGRIAQSIVKFRNLKGSFRNRRQLLDVPGLGPKGFEQAAGFLRIQGGDEALDSSAVHPESYGTVQRIAADLGLSPENLLGNQTAIASIKPRAKDFCQPGQGVSIQDILDELLKPGRDPRLDFEQFNFDETVRSINDINEGMILAGKVTNVVAFGAFIDIGIHEQGLAHISQLSDNFVKDPHLVVKPGQSVMVRVIGVDPVRKRVSLSLKGMTKP